MPVEQITAIKDGDKGFQIDYYFQAQQNGQTTNAVTAKVEEAIEMGLESGAITEAEADAIRYSAMHKPAGKQDQMAEAIMEVLQDPAFTDPDTDYTTKANMLLEAATANGYAENNQTFADLEMTFWAMAFGYEGDLRQQF